MEWDTGEGDNEDRILHTTDVSRQSANASATHLSKKKQLKQKTNAILHIGSEKPDVVEPVTLAPSPTTAATPYRLNTQSPEQGLHGFKDIIRQPVETIKAKVERKSNRELAGNLATQAVSHAHNVELVHAQDRVTSAETEQERLSASSDLEALKKARQDMFVRWTMDRHVLKIRRLERKAVSYGSIAESIMKEKGRTDTSDWRGYGRHVRQWAVTLLFLSPLTNA